MFNDPEWKAERAALTRARNIHVEDRAVFLRVQGFSFNEISEKMNIPVNLIQKAINRGLRRAKKELLENSHQLVSLELLRLDQLFSLGMARARQGDGEGLRDCLKVMERRAKYLGLDAAIKINPNAGEEKQSLDNLPLEKLMEMQAILESVNPDAEESEEIDYGNANTDGDSSGDSPA